MTLHLKLWQDMIDLCKSLNQEQYTYKSAWLNGVSIAEHLRHSFEFYACLINGSESKVINYESRQRNREIEANKMYAVEQMNVLKKHLEVFDLTEAVKVESKDTLKSQIDSSFERELLYCLDHAIHHQALIKIGLKELDLDHLIAPEFGIAYSTLRHRQNN